MLSRFPAAFRPPAFASWAILFPPGSWAFLTVGLPDALTAPDPDGVSTFRTHEIRPGWVPPIPRDGGALPAGDAIPSRRLPLPSGQSLHPAATSHRRGSRLRGINGGSLTFTRPVFPSPVAPGWNGSPWASPPSFAPRRYRRRTSGRGQAIEH